MSVSPKSFTVGTVTFKITNNGRLAHVFVVAGKRTSVKPHQTATVKVAFKSAGKFAYTWTGKKSITGQLTVTGGASTSTAHTTTTVATTTTTTTGPTACSNPTTTVNVGLFEYRFELSANTVPAGCIQFVITNKGTEPHNFDLTTANRSGAILAPGQSETWSVQLTAKHYIYVCDVPFHIDRGMTGELIVT